MKNMMAGLIHDKMDFCSLVKCVDRDLFGKEFVKLLVVSKENNALKCTCVIKESGSCGYKNHTYNDVCGYITRTGKLRNPNSKDYKINGQARYFEDKDPLLITSAYLMWKKSL